MTFEGDEAEANFENSVGLDVTTSSCATCCSTPTPATPATTSRAPPGPTIPTAPVPGASYLINRNLSLDATYRFTKRDSDDNDAEYDRNIVLVGITARL